MHNKTYEPISIFSAHIMQIFQRRGLLISEEMVKNYLRKYVEALWGSNSKDDRKRFAMKKTRIEKENK